MARALTAGHRAAALFGLVIALVIALSAASCGGASPGAADGVGDDARAYAGSIRSRDVARGRYVFFHVCAPCHEDRVNPEGYGWEPPRMRRQVREGNHLMPRLPHSLVSPGDLEAVLAFLTTNGAVAGELPTLGFEDDEWDEEAFVADEAAAAAAAAAAAGAEQAAEQGAALDAPLDVDEGPASGESPGTGGADVGTELAVPGAAVTDWQAEDETPLE